MKVLKRNGETEPFDKNKFVISLERAGFESEEINTTLTEIEEYLYDGITTDEIYKKSLKILKNNEIAEPIIKYSLKKAVLELGPSGFPFEQLISKIYQENGYKTETGLMIKGRCIEHEIDIIAYNENELIFIEAKFHNDQNLKSDTKVALYVKARYDDLLDSSVTIEGKERKITKALLITNTAFTNNSKKYVECVGTFDMISWTYPKRKGLLKMMEDAKIHPITSIPQLSKSEKNNLIELGCIYCRDLIKNPDFLNMAKVTGSKRTEVLNTAKIICKDIN